MNTEVWLRTIYSEYPPNWDKPATLSPILNSETPLPIAITLPTLQYPNGSGLPSLLNTASSVGLTHNYSWLTPLIDAITSSEMFLGVSA